MHCYTNLYAVFQCKIFNQKILIINKKNSSVIRFIMSICHFYDFLKINQMNAGLIFILNNNKKKIKKKKNTISRLSMLLSVLYNVYNKLKNWTRC